MTKSQNKIKDKFKSRLNYVRAANSLESIFPDDSPLYDRVNNLKNRIAEEAKDTYSNPNDFALFFTTQILKEGLPEGLYFFTSASENSILEEPFYSKVSPFFRLPEVDHLVKAIIQEVDADEIYQNDRLLKKEIIQKVDADEIYQNDRLLKIKMVASFHEQGIGTEKNAEKAYEYYQQAVAIELKNKNADIGEVIMKVDLNCSSQLLSRAREEAIIDLIGENNIASRAGYLTPLHCAVIRKNPKIVGSLMAQGAKIDAADEDGLTPLHYAVNKHQGIAGFHYTGKEDNSEIVSMLLDNGANINAASNVNKITPLMEAIERGADDKIIYMLIDKGADLTISDVDYMTPLMYAVNNRNHKVACALIAKGAVVDSDTKEFFNPYESCLKSEDLNLIKLMTALIGIQKRNPEIKINSQEVREFLKKCDAINEYAQTPSEEGESVNDLKTLCADFVKEGKITDKMIEDIPILLPRSDDPKGQIALSGLKEIANSLKKYKELKNEFFQTNENLKAGEDLLGSGGGSVEENSEIREYADNILDSLAKSGLGKFSKTKKAATGAAHDILYNLLETNWRDLSGLPAESFSKNEALLNLLSGYFKQNNRSSFTTRKSEVVLTDHIIKVSQNNLETINNNLGEAFAEIVAEAVKEQNNDYKENNGAAAEEPKNPSPSIRAEDSEALKFSENPLMKSQNKSR